MTRIAINGFGRIGRAFLRVAHERPELEIVAINDLGDAEQFAYLLKYDSVYGRAHSFRSKRERRRSWLMGKTFQLFSEADPAKLPWKDLNIDIVVESTGFFTEL